MAVTIFTEYWSSLVEKYIYINITKLFEKSKFMGCSLVNGILLVNKSYLNFISIWWLTFWPSSLLNRYFTKRILFRLECKML